MSRSRKWGMGLAGLVVAAVLAVGSTALAHDDDHDGGHGGYPGHGGQMYAGRGGPNHGGHNHFGHGHPGHGRSSGQWSVGFGGGSFGNSLQFGYVSPRGGFSIGIAQPNYGYGSGYGRSYGGYPRSSGCNQQYRGSSFGAPPGGWGW